MTQYKIITAPGCVQCKATMRTLDSRGISYETVLITEELREELKEKGFMSLPVVYSPSGESWSGYQPEKLI